MKKETALAIAIEEVKKYQSITELRKEDWNLYMFLRRWELLHLAPKGNHITKLSHTNQELIEMAIEYKTLADMRKSHPRLLNALKKRNCIPEKFIYNKPEKVKKPLGRPKKEKQPEEEVGYRYLIPEQFRNNRKGPFACFISTKTEGGFICGRCREEHKNNEVSPHCKDLCKKCGYARFVYDRDHNKIELNIFGNVKDEYCHSILHLEDGPVYIGIELDAETRKKVIEGGYFFILKEQHKKEKDI
jgi:hypothetical protein